MVGAVTTLGVWAISLPFGAVQLWWGRRYGLEQQGYVAWALAQWPALLGQVVGLTIALTVLLLLAGRFGRRWWLVAAPLFAAVGAVLVLVLPWAETLGTRPPHDTPRRRAHPPAGQGRGGGRHAGSDRGRPRRDDGGERDGDRDRPLGARLHLGHAPRRPLLDRADRGRRRARVRPRRAPPHLEGPRLVAAARPCPGSGWSSSRPAGAAGSSGPEVVPLALLVLAVFGLAITPFGNAVSRRYEAEADWSALTATHDPQPRRRASSASSRATTSSQPNPPLLVVHLVDEPPDGDAADRDGPRLRGATALESCRVGVSGRFLIPSRADHFDQESCIASSSSFMNRVDMLTRETTTPGTSPSSTSWSMRANVIVNS